MRQIFIYSQTHSNDHLYKTVICLRQPMLSPPKQIPMQLLLYSSKVDSSFHPSKAD